jgi:deoxyadenosine/deoxycytidine kinase
MGKLIAFVGPSGVGKTSLVQALSRAGEFAVAYEQHAERPFHSNAKQDKQFTLANQLDYLIFRAEQERTIRQSPLVGLLDGGLDLDFHGFAKLFHARGWLNDPEYDLCGRFYELARELLPPPELIVRLSAREETIRARLSSRNRVNIASAEDTALFNQFVEEWLLTVAPPQVLRLEVSQEPIEFPQSVPAILARLNYLVDDAT